LIAGVRQIVTSINPGIGGDDTITGDAGADSIIGGVGADTIHGNVDADLILGDNGNLDYRRDANADLDVITTTDPTIDGDDTIFGGTANDAITGDNGRDLIFGDHGTVDRDVAAHLSFTSVDTGATQGGAADTIYGNDGDDTVIGGQGSDLIFGGNGDDD